MNLESDTPTIEFLMLADRAETLNGKLYVMGGAWDRIWTSDIEQPYLLSLAIAVLVPWNATNRPHALAFTFEDEDGNMLPERGESEFNVGRPFFLTPGETQRLLLAVPALQMKLPRYGIFTLKASINGGAPQETRFQVATSMAGTPSG